MKPTIETFIVERKLSRLVDMLIGCAVPFASSMMIQIICMFVQKDMLLIENAEDLAILRE